MEYKKGVFYYSIKVNEYDVNININELIGVLHKHANREFIFTKRLIKQIYRICNDIRFSKMLWSKIARLAWSELHIEDKDTLLLCQLFTEVVKSNIFPLFYECMRIGDIHEAKELTGDIQTIKKLIPACNPLCANSDEFIGIDAEVFIIMIKQQDYNLFSLQTYMLNELECCNIFLEAILYWPSNAHIIASYLGVNHINMKMNIVTLSVQQDEPEYLKYVLNNYHNPNFNADTYIEQMIDISANNNILYLFDLCKFKCSAIKHLLYRSNVDVAIEIINKWKLTAERKQAVSVMNEIYQGVMSYADTEKMMDSIDFI